VQAVLEQQVAQPQMVPVVAIQCFQQLLQLAVAAVVAALIAVPTMVTVAVQAVVAVDKTALAVRELQIKVSVAGMVHRRHLTVAVAVALEVLEATAHL
jgi:hypothetical protein